MSRGAHAQIAPSQVTPQTLRPLFSIPPSIPSVEGGQPVQAPAGAERLNVLAGRVAITGSFDELLNETRALIATIEKRRVTVAEVYAFANALEQAYARAGYVLVRVTVPEQKLNDGGTVRIVVIDGFVEAVDVAQVPAQARDVVTARTSGLIRRGRITIGEIERRLLIAGDVPGLRLKSTLARGKVAGGTLLVLDGTHRLVTATANIDNRLPASLASWNYGTSVALNSALGLGEQLYASGQSSGDPALLFDSASPLRVLGGGAVLPIGIDGWIVNPEYTNARSQPRPAIGGFATIGQFERFALRTSYPVIRTRTALFSFNAAFEHIEQSIELPLFGIDLNRDRYNALRVGVSYDTALPAWGTGLQLGAGFSQGLGGRNEADALASGVPLSRLGAGPDFSKANFDARIFQPLLYGFHLDLIGRAQTSFGTPLLVSEQFALDGPQALSAFSSGTLNVDEGGTLRVELARPFAATFDPAVPLVLSPYGFGSIGAGRLVEPTIIELSDIRGGSVGAGVRSGIELGGGYHGVTLGLEVARQFSSLPLRPHAWRGNVVMSVRF
jgi:hemolysin activation/secretion protein